MGEGDITMQTKQARQARFSMAVLFLILSLLAGNRLQAQAGKASIQGRVSDATGAAIANAKITVRNTDTGVAQTIVSDDQGRYNAPDLPVGTYEVSAAEAGFKTAVHRGIVLNVGSQPVVDLVLAVGQVQEAITVEGLVTQVETTSAAVGSLVNDVQMRELPLNGRNVEQLILLSPGVNAISAGVESQNSFFGRQSNYSVAGSRAEGQAFLLDNQDMQNFWGHGIGSSGIGSSLGVDGIAEFQTLTNTYSAQYGGSGAAINSVSKAGTNNLHGAAFEFLRNSALDARNYFDGPNGPPEFHRHQFGGSLGGPIKKDKAFFFVNYEGLRQLLGETKVATVPDAAHRTVTATNPAVAAAIAKTLALYPATPLVTKSGTVNLPQVASQIAHENYLLGRVDYTFSQKDSLFGRYLLDRGDFLEPFPSNPIAYWNEQTLNRNQFFTLEERHTFSTNVVNAARFSYSRPTTSGVTLTHAPNNALNFFPTTDRQDGVVIINGLSTMGPNNTTPFTFVQNKFSVGDDVIWTKGAHVISVGMMVLREQTNTFDQFEIGGQYTFNSISDFLAGKVAALVGVLPDNLAPNGKQIYNRDTRDTELAPYIQDQWRMTQRLTLNMGVRYDFVTNPYEIHGYAYNFTNPPQAAAPGVPNLLGVPQLANIWSGSNPSRFNFDPRIGLAFDPFADHKTAIRAGFGLFHNVLRGRTYFPGIWDTPPMAFGQQLPSATSAPVYGQPYSSVTPTPLRVQPGTDSRIDTTPYMTQWNLNVEHDFGGNIVTVGYVGSAGVDLIVPLDVNPSMANAGSCGSPTGQPTYACLINGKVVPNPRINPQLGVINLMEPIGHSTYNSLQASLTRHLGKGVDGQVSYTYSHCMDNGSATYGQEGNNNGGVVNPWNMLVERSNCGFDIRQALRVNGVYMLPFRGNQLVQGWQLSGILTATTGPPITPDTGFDLMGFGSADRPNVVPGCSNLVTGNPNQWFNPSCFALPPVGVPGNARRTSIPGPNFNDLDFSLMKDTKVSKVSESFEVQFRAEFFNILNHTNFALPSNKIFTSAAIANPNAPNAISQTEGLITQTLGTSRQMQFGLKLIF